MAWSAKTKIQASAARAEEIVNRIRHAQQEKPLE
jgi:hypothetical protein